MCLKYKLNSDIAVNKNNLEHALLSGKTQQGIYLKKKIKNKKPQASYDCLIEFKFFDEN